MRFSFSDLGLKKKENNDMEEFKSFYQNIVFNNLT